MATEEFSYTFRRHSIVLTRENENRNWYIRVRGPDGLHVYDGYWRESAGKTLKEALYEAKVGAQLIRAAPPMDPEAARPAAVERPAAQGEASQ
jgi:hypothetical protein